MAYDKGLNARVINILDEQIKYKSKNMFGGVCYLINGNMLGGIIADELIIRAGKSRHNELLELEHTNVLDITGRIMPGWIKVQPEGLESDEKLKFWLAIGITFASSLPPK